MEGVHVSVSDSVVSSDNHSRIDWCQISQMADGWIGNAISSIPGECDEAEGVPKIPSGLQGF